MPMVNPNSKMSGRPKICYRPILPSDLDTIEHLHGKLFPIRYESLFFQDVVNGHDIVSWGAVDRSRPEGQSDELIGFVTARIVLAKESEIVDILGYDSSKSDQTLIYILTLGVVDAYRNLGIASSLIREVIKYASSIPTCRAVYLHVISHNNAAIFLYKKMSFKCIRRLQGFYLINGQHYDSYLFVYYVNGGRSACSPFSMLWIYDALVKNKATLLLITINSYGIVVEVIYLSIFLFYTPKKLRLAPIKLLLLLNVFGFGAMLLSALYLSHGNTCY